MKLSPVRRMSLSQSIAQQLRQHIFARQIPPGGKLPPERELAESLGTNRNTLREAIRSLESLGLVTVRQGDGVRVADFQADAQINLLPFYLLEVPLKGDAPEIFEDLLLMRRTLLGLAAHRAASRQLASSMAELRGLLELQRKQERAREEMIGTDLEFFACMVRASGSLVMRWLFNSFVPIYDQVIETFPELWRISEDYVSFLERLVEAVEEGRAAEAHDAILTHFEALDREIVGAASVLTADLETPLGALLSQDLLETRMKNRK